MRRLLSVVAAALIAASAGNAATIGNEVIDRGTSDGWSNFSLVFTDILLTDGMVTAASNFGAVSGDIAYLFFSEDQGEFTLEASISATASAGVVSTLTGLSTIVEAGWMLGLYQGTGKVDFDNVGAWVNHGPTMFTNKNTGMPTVGSSIAIFASRARAYSVSVEVEDMPPPVPLPASLPLLVAGIAAFAGLRRRTSA